MCGSFLSARNDLATSARPSVRYERSRGGVFGARVRRRLNVMIAKAPHQTPADASDSRTAIPFEMPSPPANETNARFAASRMPPPRYPSA